jgi:hypothetical protein
MNNTGMRSVFGNALSSLKAVTPTLSFIDHPLGQRGSTCAAAFAY